MQSALIGWLGVVIVVAGVLVTLGADFFRQRDITAATTAPAEGSAQRQPGGRVFWLTVAAVVLAVTAVVATVVRLATLA
ncbi:MAG: hypothetical protein ABIR83_11505 [Nakamurella sp.]